MAPVVDQHDNTDGNHEAQTVSSLRADATVGVARGAEQITVAHAGNPLPAVTLLLIVNGPLREPIDEPGAVIGNSSDTLLSWRLPMAMLEGRWKKTRRLSMENKSILERCRFS